MRALITGISGQDGHYLGELLLSKGYEVFGLVRDEASRRRVSEALPKVTLLRGDVTVPPSLAAAVAEASPHEVYNLAAISTVTHSWDGADATFGVTARGTANLLEALRGWHGDDLSGVSFYQASTSEMFGHAHAGPQCESTEFRPASPYGIAKVFSHHAVVGHREHYGLRAACGILFNHESPRRGEQFVTRKITLAIARIALGLQTEVELGSLDARRDWGYAGDYVDAMWRMLQHDTPADYVIATGQTHSIRDVLDVGFREVGVDDWSSHVAISPRFSRPVGAGQLVGDASKAERVLGWKPTVNFEQLIAMMVRADVAEQQLLNGLPERKLTGA